MLATYHNHSTWSDGKASLEAIVEAAARMNIGELGISDHWVLHPQGLQHKWAMRSDRLDDYVDAILELRAGARGAGAKPQASPAVRLGLEVDWFPGSSVPLRGALEKHPFDYLIGSVHEIIIPGIHDRQVGAVGGFMIDGSPAAWEKLDQGQRNALHRQYWINVKSLAEWGGVDIIAHIDLPKKFAFYPTIDLAAEIGEALDAIAATTTSAGNRAVVEINTAGWHKPCADAYPALDILHECRRRNIPATISADAHQPEHLLRDFDRAAARLAEAGYAQVTRFHQRQVRFESLEEAMRGL